jgi:hypothetical protein
MPALSAEGIALHWSLRCDDGAWIVTCHLHHAASLTSAYCDWPVITSKGDAQGFASGSTYARRYSLMAVTGLAPEDDDGNAASGQQATKHAAPQVARAEEEAAKLLPGCMVALETGNNDWLVANVLSAPPAVRQSLARSLTAEQKQLLASLKEGE